jgi:hypothetical protein
MARSGIRPALRLDEDHVQIRLLPTPLIELPVVNGTAKPLERSFRLEFLGRDGQSASSITGTSVQADPTRRPQRKSRPAIQLWSSRWQE